jgi:hemin uptake protein HemP
MQPSKSARQLDHAPRKVLSDALLGEAKELLIVHNGREYRLRLTQNGKLILTA